MKSQKGPTSIEVIGTIVLTIILLIGMAIWNMFSCHNYGTLTDRVTKFSIVNGCFVKTPSGWIPQEEMSKRAYGNSIVEEK